MRIRGGGKESFVQNYMNVLGFEFHLLGEVKVEKTMQQGFLPLASSKVNRS